MRTYTIVGLTKVRYEEQIVEQFDAARLMMRLVDDNITTACAPVTREPGCR